ncbi:EF-P 5-aminopentanol modification-associated protein YfmH [Pediococcus acidilactici]|uniref:EF-P 5-aminopentanol modification-associated protein YfmH n=1 Tax=Pediococcus acidilactici TaxID=1254 RepID=UPI00194F60E8|nr:pitrilysin family protein [Pediococcus acidilactici]MBM6585633.1 insulinase family protein [Pediococcus acidilactici]
MQIKEKAYSVFDERLFSATLANGLQINILPKADFQKTYAVFTTNLGSMDRNFRVGEQKLQIPAGTAHFLEHKLFEKADYDAFQIFTRNGADSNAFTSYSKTSYLFSATSRLKENLTTLLDFVQDPYFSSASVAKEQGIIGQEIQMYNDDVDWQLYMGMMRNLFPKQALSEDIAGTSASIAQITPELLYKVHQVFYHPQNMHLFVTGNLDPQTVVDWVEENQRQKQFTEFVQPVNLQKAEQKILPVVGQSSAVCLANRPKVMLGIRNNRYLPAPGLERLKYLLTLDLGLYLLLSSSSKNYLKLYDEGLLDDTFGYDLNNERDELFLTMGGDSDHPQQLAAALKEILRQGLTDTPELAADFALAKKEMYGRCIARMNSLEAIANSFEGALYGNATIFDEAQMFKEISLTEVVEALGQFVSEQVISSFEIKPK